MILIFFWLEGDPLAHLAITQPPYNTCIGVSIVLLSHSGER